MSRKQNMAAPITPNYDSPSPLYAAGLTPIVKLGRRYHEHRVLGIERIPSEGPVLLALNHSLATYDILFLVQALHEASGRMCAALGDHSLFKVPLLRQALANASIVPGSHEHGRELLGRGRVVAVAPGGMREALRPGEERYDVRWQRRTGFVRLSIESGAPIVLAACPDADRLFHVYESQLTKFIYNKLRLPMPIVRGWGPTLIPRRVKLTHVVNEPLTPPALERDRLEEQVSDWHATVLARMSSLMAQARELGAERAASSV